MEELLVFELAGLKVAVRPLLAGLDAFAAGYAHSAAPGEVEACDFLVTVSPRMIAAERERATEGVWSDSYLQQLAVYRAIAEEAPKRGVFLMHAAVVGFAGKAYAFAAPSGTGKSTHLRLWKRCFGNAAQVINGDKPLLRVGAPAQEGAPVVTAYGTPWCGKEGWQVNASAPLAGLCFLERGEKDSCRRIEPADALPAAMRQVYLPSDPESAFLSLGLLDELLNNVALYRLRCTMRPSAARASFEAMTRLSFDDCLCEEARSGC